MSGHHHHVSRKNLLHFDDLRKQFGEPGEQTGDATHDIVGDRYIHLLTEMAQIVEHQWRAGASRGLIKGFLLSGPPGTGKTTLARRLAYELGQRFGQQSQDSSVVLAFVDGAEVARSRYGESEERILDLFAHARSGFTAAEQRSVILFDDVESIFMARGSQHAKEWHFSQDSVFFHAVDDLDTSRTVLVLTSNRPDLVDDAIRDRFLTYHVDYPDLGTLTRIAMNMAALQKFSPDQRRKMEERLRDAAESGSVRSLRDAQRFVIQRYVADVLGRDSLAQSGSRPPSTS
jgi:SpoVK/Ycf46/Vps4 family AAA+-type ATPase